MKVLGLLTGCGKACDNEFSIKVALKAAEQETLKPD